MPLESRNKFGPSGVSVHQALPKMSQNLAGHISLGSLTVVIGKVAAFLQGIQKPTLWDPLAVFVYAGVLLDMGIIQAALFAITILGFIAVGMGGLVGPVSIPWLIVPRLNWLFWNWFSFILQYSFYSVVANALVFIWTNVLISFIDQVSTRLLACSTRCRNSFVASAVEYTRPSIKIRPV